MTFNHQSIFCFDEFRNKFKNTHFHYRQQQIIKMKYFAYPDLTSA